MFSLFSCHPLIIFGVDAGVIIYIYIYVLYCLFPKYASKHKGFLPSFKNWLFVPLAAVSFLLLRGSYLVLSELPIVKGFLPS